jgi:predicted DsbA family dithiol-disulfide isomerase
MQVEVWSDIACPWCYIGKRRFERALANFEHADAVELIWRSFELDPNAPSARPGDRAEHLARKYGVSASEAQAMENRVSDLAAAEGLDYRLDLARGANMFDGHRLIHLAAAHGLQDAMKERLLRAYFTEGRLLSDRDTLVALAQGVGIEADDAAAVLDSERFAADVRADEQAAARLGISGVPTFVLDRRIGISGAQASDALLELLRTGWEQQRAASSPA